MRGLRERSGAGGSGGRSGEEWPSRPLSSSGRWEAEVRGEVCRRSRESTSDVLWSEQVGGASRVRRRRGSLWLRRRTPLVLALLLALPGLTTAA